MLDMHRIVTDAGLLRTLGSFGEDVSGALLRMPLVLVRGVLDLIHLERDRVERLRDSEKSDPRADVLRELDSMPDRPSDSSEPSVGIGRGLNTTCLPWLRIKSRPSRGRHFQILWPLRP